MKYFIRSIDWPKSESSDEEYCIQIPEWILYYRGIYILNTGCNTAFGKLFLPFIKAAIVLCLIVSFSAVIQKYEYLDIWSFFLVSTVTPTTFLLLAPISTVMSSMYDIPIPAQYISQSTSY